MEEIVIVGFGGHAKSVADSIERTGKYKIVGYTDVVEREVKYRYLGQDDIYPELYSKGIRNVAMGLGYMGKGQLREKLYYRLKEIGFFFPPIIDSSAIISTSTQVKEGAFIGKGVIINAEAIIGKMSIINSGAVVEHESYVGEFAHVAVGAVLCGNVIVKRAAFVGANATVIQGKKVDEREIVPAGMVVR